MVTPKVARFMVIWVAKEILPQILATTMRSLNLVLRKEARFIMIMLQ